MDIPIGGSCDDRFARVRVEFEANFRERGDVGAAVCVSVDGERVVDLWGGWRDSARNRAWDADTLVNIFSIGKGLTAACVAHLVGQGEVDVDAPLADNWPEFAANGKSRITLRDVLTHRAGLPAIRKRLPPDAMLAWDVMTDALAEQEPWWEPGSAHGYHVNTFGFLVGEAVRRATGRSVGEILRDEFVRPLGADAFIGLAESEFARVAEFLWAGTALAEPDIRNLTDAQLMEFNAYRNPAGVSGAGFVNTDAWRRAEIPSTNGHASARGVERVYASLAAGGALRGVRVVAADALARSTVEQVCGDDLILHRPSRFALGFQLTQPERPLGPNARAFGHFGAGGSLGFCDPDAGVAFGYVMNAMGPRWQNPRNAALIDAVYEALSPSLG